MKLRLFLFFQASLILLTSCALGGDVTGDADTEKVTVGRKWPNFSVVLTDGGSVDSSELNKQPSVVVFFNTACHDCQRELPVVEKLYKEYASKARFLCISRAEEQPAVDAFWNKHGLTLPVSAQPTKEVFQLFATRTIPRIYIGDKAGTIRHIFIEKASEQKLREALESVVE